jgi:hypothetical protein
MSLYEILPVFCPTQSVHGKICFGMHLGVRFYISRIYLQATFTRFGADMKAKNSLESQIARTLDHTLRIFITHLVSSNSSNTCISANILENNR